MGKLAFWRALEGAGKGIAMGAAYREESRQKQMQRDYEMRLAEMKLKADRDLADQTDKRMRDTADQAAAVDVTLATQRSEQERQQHEERMTAEEQRHTENMAAQGRATTIAEETLKQQQAEFERGRWERFDVTERVPAEGGAAATAPVEGESKMQSLQRMMLGDAGSTETRTRQFRYDKQDGTLQERINGEWKDALGTLEGPDKKLYENPSHWPEYLKRAGDLPAWFIKMYGDPREAVPGGSVPH